MHSPLNYYFILLDFLFFTYIKICTNMEKSFMQVNKIKEKPWYNANSKTLSTHSPGQEKCVERWLDYWRPSYSSELEAELKSVWSWCCLLYWAVVLRDSGHASSPNFPQWDHRQPILQVGKNVKKQSEAISLVVQCGCDNAEQVSVSLKSVLSVPAGEASCTPPMLATVCSHV